MGVYKVIKNSNLTPEKDQVRSNKELRRSNISPAEFGLSCKCKEIHFQLKPENTISDNWDRFSQNYFLNDNREGKKSCPNLSGPSQVSFYNSSGINQGYRSPLFLYIGRENYNDSVKIPSALKIPIVSNNIKYQFKDRITLVGKKTWGFRMAKIFLSLNH